MIYRRCQGVIVLYDLPPLSVEDEAVLGLIEDLWRRLRHEVREPRRWTGLLRRVALARAIRGSNSIEGFEVSLDDAFAALDDEEPLTATEAAWAAVTGYRDAMTYVLQLADDEDFEYSEDLLRSLHFMMQSYDLTKRPGRYRKADIYVVDEDRDEVVYEGPDAGTVPDLMAALVASLASRGTAPALVRAAMAHLNLAMVHPFKDGNGRMARCLQALVLAREGVIAPEFCSIEEYLGRNEEAYYEILREVGQGAWRPEGDASAWVRFCLVAHYRQALTVLRRAKSAERLWLLAEEEVDAIGLNDRVVAPLYFALSGRQLRNATYRQVENVTPNLASRDLAELVRTGLLAAFGEKRGRYYLPVTRLKEASVRIRRSVRLEHPVDADPYDLVRAGTRSGKPPARAPRGAARRPASRRRK
jgi:Fic family protein